MDLIHNSLNDSIWNMEQVVNKGQPFAKRNKDRRIREILRTMRAEQDKPPLFNNVWFYFKLWARAEQGKLKRKISWEDTKTKRT